MKMDFNIEYQKILQQSNSNIIQQGLMDFLKGTKKGKFKWNANYVFSILSGQITNKFNDFFIKNNVYNFLNQLSEFNMNLDKSKHEFTFTSEKNITQEDLNLFCGEEMKISDQKISKEKNFGILDNPAFKLNDLFDQNDFMIWSQKQLKKLNPTKLNSTKQIDDGDDDQEQQSSQNQSIQTFNKKNILNQGIFDSIKNMFFGKKEVSKQQINNKIQILQKVYIRKQLQKKAIGKTMKFQIKSTNIKNNKNSFKEKYITNIVFSIDLSFLGIDGKDYQYKVGTIDWQPARDKQWDNDENLWNMKASDPKRAGQQMMAKLGQAMYTNLFKSTYSEQVINIITMNEFSKEHIKTNMLFNKAFKDNQKKERIKQKSEKLPQKVRDFQNECNSNSKAFSKNSVKLIDFQTQGSDGQNGAIFSGQLEKTGKIITFVYNYKEENNE